MRGLILILVLSTWSAFANADARVKIHECSMNVAGKIAMTYMMPGYSSSFTQFVDNNYTKSSYTLAGAKAAIHNVCMWLGEDGDGDQFFTLQPIDEEPEVKGTVKATLLHNLEFCNDIMESDLVVCEVGYKYE